MIKMLIILISFCCCKHITICSVDANSFLIKIVKKLIKNIDFMIIIV